MGKVDGFHHLAISTADIKAQIEFFTDVLGCELQALFWMHGVEGAWHGFCKLNDHCTVSFVQMPENAEATEILGVSHAANGASPSSPGTMQHVAMNVPDRETLSAMRDRIRDRGINVMGPIEHGICTSIYFAGPEGLNLELATNEHPIDPERWVDAEVASLAGMSAEDVERYVRPAPYVNDTGAPVPQPEIDWAKPQMRYPKETLEQIMSVPDEVMESSRAFAEAPNPGPEEG